MTPVAFRAAIVVATLSPAGCSVFIPAHTLSLDSKGERVQVRMLSVREVRDKYEADWRAVFAPRQLPPPVATTGAPPTALIAALGIAATKATLQFAVKRVEREAKSYEAQFSGDLIIDDFWIRDTESATWAPRYYGFEVVRQTDMFSDPNPAFKLVFGIAPQYDKRQFLVAPLSVETRSSRSKIVAEGEVKQKAQVTLISSWLSESTQKVLTLADATITLPNANLDDNSNSFRAAPQSGDKQLPIGAVMSFAGVPRSEGADGDSDIQKAGELRVRIVITQADASEARESVELARDLIPQNRDDIAAGVGEWIKQQINGK